MTVYRYELRRSAKSFLIWSFSVGALALMCMLLYPSLQSQVTTISDSFSEMGGFTAAFGIVTFAWVFLRERGLSSRRLVIAEVLGLFGGVGALVLMAHVTVSGFTDAGGPVDWLLVGLIWGGGLAGATILSYAVMGLFARRY